jgi:RHS repeat-associated protein
MQKAYFPFGECWQSQGNLPTDKLFTGQRLDGTGLYYYGGRYYDPNIGRFISADTFTQWSTEFDVVSDPLTVNAILAGLGSVTAPQGNYPSFTLQAPVNPQNLNRYSYVRNNPLAYTDPYGWWTFGLSFNININLGFSGSIGISFVVDDNLNWAITSDHTSGTGGSNSVGIGASLEPTWTSKDTVYDLANDTIYKADITYGEVGQMGPGTVACDEGFIGGYWVFGVGASWPQPTLMGDIVSSDIIGSNEMLENYSPQNFFYDMTNTFVSPEDAYYFDYYYDGYSDYGYNYDAYYYDYYYDYYDYGCNY